LHCTHHYLLSCAGVRSDLRLLVQHPQHEHRSFDVHRAFLQLRCPRLTELAADGADSITVIDMTPHAANSMLHFIYTGKEGWRSSAYYHRM
jgi:hypothetical protein